VVDLLKEFNVSKNHITSLIIGVLLSTTAHAATVYVSDIQFVAIREGLDNSTRAVERGLKSGTPLELLEQNEGYSKVRTPSGNEGWVADYFLSEDTVIRDQLSNLQTQVNRITQSRNELSTTLNTNQQKVRELNDANTLLQNENDDLKQQLLDLENLSKEAKIIVAKNETVSYEIASLKQQASTAITQANKLKESTSQKWFIIGAVTLFGGLFLGLILPNLRRKKNGTGSW
jgi:SH3 domain protein